MDCKYLKLLIFYFAILSRTLFAEKSVLEKIDKIELQDRLKLNALFYLFVEYEHFGYTLFGDKPVSFGSYFRLTPLENYIELGQCDGVIWKQWDVWEKYKHEFLIEKFLFFGEDDYIILINKEAFLEKIIHHLDVFENVLGHKVDPKQLLLDIQNKKNSFFDTIKNNDLLLGILLGYGKTNALVYTQQQKICKPKSLTLFCKEPRFNLLRVECLHFMKVSNHPETILLEKKYAQLRGVVSAKYANGDFFSTSMIKLTE